LNIFGKGIYNTLRYDKPIGVHIGAVDADSSTIVGTLTIETFIFYHMKLSNNSVYA